MKQQATEVVDLLWSYVPCGRLEQLTSRSTRVDVVAQAAQTSLNEYINIHMDIGVSTTHRINEGVNGVNRLATKGEKYY